MAKHKKKKRTKKQRATAARKAWRTRKACAALGKHKRGGKHRGIIGGLYARGKTPGDYLRRSKKGKKASHKKGKKKGRKGMAMNICRKCGRSVAGGDKGLATHNRNQH